MFRSQLQLKRLCKATLWILWGVVSTKSLRAESKRNLCWHNNTCTTQAARCHYRRFFFCILQLFSAFCNAVKWIRAVAQGFQVVPTPCCFCHSPRLHFFSLKVLPKKINATASTTASATAHIANSFQVVKPTFVATAVMPEEILSRSSFCARRDLNPNLN